MVIFLVVHGTLWYFMVRTNDIFWMLQINIACFVVSLGRLLHGYLFVLLHATSWQLWVIFLIAFIILLLQTLAQPGFLQMVQGFEPTTFMILRDSS